MKFTEGYLTVAELCELGWTRGLIKRFLGHPDRLFPVDHWRNYSGKKAWLISTVELIEMTQGFEAAFLQSVKFRKISRAEIERAVSRIYELRESCQLTLSRSSPNSKGGFRSARHRWPTCSVRPVVEATGHPTSVEEGRRSNPRTPGRKASYCLGLQYHIVSA